MTNPRYAPEFSLRIDGAPAPAELRASVTSVRLESAFGAADRVELTLANEQLRWLDHPLLKLDTELTLSVGYAPDPLEQLFVGEIVGHAATFPGGGSPTLTVSAQDRRVRMQRRQEAALVRDPGSDDDERPDPRRRRRVARRAARTCSFPIFDPVGAALSVILGGASAIAVRRRRHRRAAEGDPQAGPRKRLRLPQADRAENGWEMIVDHADPLGGRMLRFFSPLDHLTPDVELGVRPLAARVHAAR